jgi:hypothetical protein
MDSSNLAKPKGVKRIVFKEIVAGDLRKFQADSNDAETGGGARDLRFRPYEEFEDVFRKLFPEIRIETRKRDGKKIKTEILVGKFYWVNSDGIEKSSEATFEPPTDARPGEGRIPVVHTYPPLNTTPPKNEGRIIALLIQRDDNKVWPHFATEKDLRSGQYDDEVAKHILQCLDASRGGRQVARGYIDFESKGGYCDA